MICDTFTFNGEYDLLEIRLNILNDFVDQFVIVEAPTTFTGKPKPLYFENNRARYAPWLDKIKYFVIDENYTPEESALAENSPNTKGASHWKHEFLQKESIKKALTHLHNDDIVFIGDVDEIWEEQEPPPNGNIGKLKLRVYPYFLNNRSDELFFGTIMGRYGDIKSRCLNHIRTHPTARTGNYAGWHFTSQGGLDEIRRKLNNSYTEESYNTAEIQQKLEERFKQNKDYIGRAFVFTKDESDLPRYLLDNKEKYGKLFL